MISDKQIEATVKYLLHMIPLHHASEAIFGEVKGESVTKTKMVAILRYAIVNNKLTIKGGVNATSEL